MKRAAVDPNNEGGRSLKRANSSLFSIATLVDDDPNASTDSVTKLLGGGNKSQNNLLLVGDVGIEGEYSTLKNTGLVPLDSDDDAPSTTPEDASTSCSSEIDEREQIEAVCKSSSIQRKKPEEDSSLPAIQSLPCEPPTPHSAKVADHRTGLVFESGRLHYDRHNRLHKERPLRVTSVQDYLAKSKPVDGEKTIYERCQLQLEARGGKEGVKVEESKRSSEELWLDDHDYLRVHLPGYMQR